MIERHKFWFPPLQQHGAAQSPLNASHLWKSKDAGGAFVDEVLSREAKMWSSYPFNGALALRGVGEALEEGAEGLFFPRQNSKQTLLKLPMIMHGCQFRLAHGSVLLKSGHEVNLVSVLSTGSSLSGAGCQRSGRSDKERTSRAKTLDGRGCCGPWSSVSSFIFHQNWLHDWHLFFMRPSVSFHGLFHPPTVPHGFIFWNRQSRTQKISPGHHCLRH